MTENYHTYACVRGPEAPNWGVPTLGSFFGVSTPGPQKKPELRVPGGLDWVTRPMPWMAYAWKVRSLGLKDVRNMQTLIREGFSGLQALGLSLEDFFFGKTAKTEALEGARACVDGPVPTS